MNILQKILFGVDFGETTDLALEKACYLGTYFDAEIIPIHANEVATFYYNAPVIDMKAIYKRNVSRMAGIRESLLKGGAKVSDPIIEEGKASNVILKAADELNIDLLLLGASKKNIMEEFLGSTAEKVIRNTSRPVFAVHPADSTREIRRVLCAIDCSPASDETLSTAIFLCRFLKARLNILHVVPISHYYPTLGELRAPISEWGHEVVPNVVQESSARTIRINNDEEKILKDYLKKFDFSDLEYGHITKSGLISDEICTSAIETACDVVIVGVNDRKGGVPFFTKGTIEKVLRNVQCSLLAVRHANVLKTDRKIKDYLGSQVTGFVA